MIGLYGEDWKVVEPWVLVEVVSDPWGTAVQFLAVILAGVISACIATAESRRRDTEQARLLVGEFLAVAKMVSESVEKAIEAATHPTESKDGVVPNDNDRDVARLAAEAIDQKLMDLKVKGAVAELHVGWDYAGQVSTVTHSLEHSGEYLRDAGGAILTSILKEDLQMYRESAGALQQKYGREGGFKFRVRHFILNRRPWFEALWGRRPWKQRQVDQGVGLQSSASPEGQSQQGEGTRKMTHTNKRV